jgi:hypothetical protein
VCPGVKEYFEFVDGAGGFFVAEVEDTFEFFKYLLPYEEFITLGLRCVIPVRSDRRCPLGLRAGTDEGGRHDEADPRGCG